MNKILGERTDKKVSNIEIKANSTVVSMKREKDKRVGDYLLVKFKYVVNYEPGVGSIQLEGSLWYTNDDLDKQMKEEKDKIELKSEAVKEITNTIIQESVVEALDVSRRIILPPPLQLPTVNVKQEKIKFTNGA
ncbi:MAG: hypothetical protein NTU61_01005 [Candidatus Altiarchaeota archaeon]|nr:hypothetical protein [Candidatus Altiarchaeota archaeon]